MIKNAIKAEICSSAVSRPKTSTPCNSHCSLFEKLLLCQGKKYFPKLPPSNYIVKNPAKMLPSNPPKKTHTHARRISLPLSPRQLSFYTIHGPKSNALHFSRKEINMSVAPIRACILTLTSGTSVMYFVEKALVDVFILAYFANQNC